MVDFRDGAYDRVRLHNTAVTVASVHSTGRRSRASFAFTGALSANMRLRDREQDFGTNRSNRRAPESSEFRQSPSQREVYRSTNDSKRGRDHHRPGPSRSTIRLLIYRRGLNHSGNSPAARGTLPQRAAARRFFLFSMRFFHQRETQSAGVRHMMSAITEMPEAGIDFLPKDSTVKSRQLSEPGE